jgi:hypothetical protein
LKQVEIINPEEFQSSSDKITDRGEEDSPLFDYQLDLIFLLKSVLHRGLMVVGQYSSFSDTDQAFQK